MADFLGSLESQTDGRFEVIIIDDASTDDNLSVVRKSRDPRLRLISRAHNRGCCSGMNDGIMLAKSPLVAFIASDDTANPRYVERILRAFEHSPNAVAAYVELETMTPEGLPLGQTGRLPISEDRFQLLRGSFLGQNQLPAPGMALRREVALGMLLPEGTVQFSDWMLHNRILMHGDIVMLREPLVRYRVSPSSLSAQSIGRLARDQLETRIMMDDFLSIRKIEFWAQVFPVEIKSYMSLPDRHAPYVLGRLALLSDIHEKRCWGYETIMRHMSEPGVAESLQREANFTHKDLMALAPTEAATLAEEASRLRRRLRRLRRAFWALCAAVSLLAWHLFR